METFQTTYCGAFIIKRSFLPRQFNINYWFGKLHHIGIGKNIFKTNFWQQMDWALQQKSHKAKGPLPLHLSTVYFSHLSYIQDQLRKCIHISKPLIVISSCCRWNKQIIILSFVKKIFRFFLVCYYISKYNKNV